MHPFIKFLIFLGFGLFGYLIGSINNAIIISNLFFKRDVRNYGSKNAGGTNTGRVFGRKAGITVMVLDILKSVFVYWAITLVFHFTNVGLYVDHAATLYFAMILVALGHCYPVYYKFKGGKAVSVVAGFILATNWVFTILGALIFFLILKLRKMVSYASILMAAIIVALTPILFIPVLGRISFYPLVVDNLYYYIPTLVGLCILLILKHRTNIERLQKGTESKITWIK